jgi:hypothetical protein
MTSKRGWLRRFAAFVIRGAGDELRLETTMPSRKKKRVHERMQKTGESYATALQNLRNTRRAKHRHLPLPPEPKSFYFDARGRFVPDDGSQPRHEVLEIQGDFDPEDLHKAWLPGTAFDDPEMRRERSLPPDVKRVLTLGEYVEARKEQTGWRLFSLNPHGPLFMGKVMSVVLVWDPREARGGTA